MSQQTMIGTCGCCGREDMPLPAVKAFTGETVYKCSTCFWECDRSCNVPSSAQPVTEEELQAVRESLSQSLRRVHDQPD